MRFLAVFLIVFTSALAGVYAAELVIQTGWTGLPYNSDGSIDRPEMVRRAAKARGEQYDPRSDAAVISDERAKGKRVFPTVSPGFYLTRDGSKISSNNVSVLPLGIVRNASSYYCNESGTPANFETDRHGFRNPDDVWNDQRTMILITGDSFGLGSCLPEQASIAGQVRSRHPATINAGQGANGPLAELATIREYAVPRKVPNVFWLFFENDLDDMERERDNPILRHYLDRGFTQQLIGRADELGPLVEAVAEQLFQSLSAAQQAPTKPHENPLLVPMVRGQLTALVKGIYSPPPAKAVDLDFFINVITTARADIADYGGRLALVYLPDCDHSTYQRDRWRDNLLRKLSDIGIPVIDGDPAISNLGASAFFFCPTSHYTPAGAKAIADLIERDLIKNF